jgi:hypothetical protein
MSFGEIGRELGRRWALLSAEEKSEFNKGPSSAAGTGVEEAQLAVVGAGGGGLSSSVAAASAASTGVGVGGVGAGGGGLSSSVVAASAVGAVAGGMSSLIPTRCTMKK